MNYTFRYYLPIYILAFTLTGTLNQQMLHIDAFQYVKDQLVATVFLEEAVNTTQAANVTEETTITQHTDVIQNTDTTTVTPYFAIAQVSDYVNVRSAPNTDSEIVGKLVNGAVAEVQTTAGKENDWFQITSGSVTGYIKAEYFIYGEEAASVMDNYVTTYAIIQADRLNVRKEASTTAERIGYLETGEKVKVAEDLGDWLHIEYTSDTDGYIAKEYTQLSEEYIYALSSTDEAEKRTTETARKDRMQTAEHSKPESIQVTFPATTYTSNEELRQSIVDNAMQYLGNKYVHGGNSLETGTDCSGFTSLLFAEYGYSISRTPSGQYSSAGRSIDYSEIQPGDIICYSSNGSSCTHVALYIGDGQIIHAANSRKGVVIYDADYDTIIGIRNVID